jgi:hypothetical protein
MNVLFHMAVGATIIVGITKINEESQFENKKISVVGFVLGALSHGILDYIPHCYPINSKVDVISSLIIFLLLIYYVKNKFKILVITTLLGSIFPDLIDLSPGIMNSLFNINLLIFDTIFPWHFQNYSGSIYINNCNISNINHVLTILFCLIIFVLNKEKLKIIIKDNENKR